VKKDDYQSDVSLVHVDSRTSSPERIVPGAVDEGTEAEHMARYQFALEKVSGRVLDLGCGVGYGCVSLLESEDITQVIGLDIAKDALSYGKTTYLILNLVLGDATNLPFKDASFDSVVCLETIEHVPSPEQLLREIARVLVPRGIAVLSTPNKMFRSPLLGQPINPYHTVEWYRGQFVRLVNQYLTVCEVLGQRWRRIPLGCARPLLRSVIYRLGLMGMVQSICDKYLSGSSSTGLRQNNLHPIPFPRSPFYDAAVTILVAQRER